MFVQRRKQKTIVDKDFQDEVKEVKSLLGQGKSLVEKASSDDDYWEALQILNKAIMKATSIQVANTYLLYFYRGTCYLKLKQLEKAERDFIEGSGLADEKGKVQIYNLLGKCKVEMAQEDPSYLEEAVKCFEKAIQFSKCSDGQAYLNLANIYRRIKNNYQAIKEYSNSLKYLKSTQQYQAFVQRGLCYRDIGEIENSIEDFEKACKLRQEEASAYFNLGINYLLILKYDMGLQKFNTAISLNESEPQFYNYKGLALYLSGQYEQCLSVYKETLRLYQIKNISSPEVGECWYNLGNAQLHLSDEDKAIEAFKKSREFDIDEELELKILYSEGLAYESKKNLLSVSKFEECLLLIKQNKSNDLYLSVLYHLGVNLHANKRYEEAISAINKILEVGCSEKCIYELRGKVHLDAEMHEKALHDFQILLSMDPNYPEVYYYLGLSKANLGEIQASISDFFKAIELGSRNHAILNGISWAYLKANKPEKALIYANIALEKQPNNQDFLIQRSMIFLELNENHKGILDLTKAMQINQENAFIYYRRGLSYYKSKQFQAAIDDLQKCFLHCPSKVIEPDIYYLIGISYSNLEEFQRAVEPLSQAIELKPQPKYYHERAKCCLLLNRNNEALADLNQVIKSQPQNAFAHFRRALAYKALKLYEDAAQNFMKARELSPDDPRLLINKKQIYEIKYRKLCEAGEQE